MTNKIAQGYMCMGGVCVWCVWCVCGVWCVCVGGHCDIVIMLTVNYRMRSIIII